MASNKGICSSCSKEGTTSVCSRCKKATYCSVTCQKRDWKNHKPRCKPKKKKSDEVVCSCPICKRDGLEKECPLICIQCGKLLHCEMCMFDKRAMPFLERRHVCIDCPPLEHQSTDPLNHLYLLKRKLRPEDAGPLENALRLGYAALQDDDSSGTGRPLPVKVVLKEVIRLADKVQYAPAMYVLGALYSGMNETEAEFSLDLGIEANKDFVLGMWSLGFQNDYTHCSKDPEKAKKYLKQAAGAGYAPAMYMLASQTMLVNIANRVPDPAWWHEATALYRRAANMGHFDAAAELALILSADEEGWGSDEDRAESIRLLKRVIRKGNPNLVVRARIVMTFLGVD